MSRKYQIEPQKKLEIFFFLLISGIFIGLLIRNMGLMPFLFQDELVYSFDARLKPLADATVPNALFLKTYRITNYCNSAFLDCARVLNLIFYFGAALAIHLIARKFVSKTTSYFVSIFSLIAPLNTYIAFLMPEMMYYFCYWSLVCLIVYARNLTSVTCWSLVGGVLGACSVIKPHAMFLLPSMVLFILYLHRFRKVKYSVTTILFIAMIFSFIVVKLLLTFWVSGYFSLFFLGSDYSSLAAETLSLEQLFKNVVNSLLSFTYHILFIILLFSFPIAYSITKIRLAPKVATESPITVTEFLVINYLNLIVLVGMTATFTGLVFESTYPFFLRYYSFVFPMFYILAACAFQDQELESLKRFKTIFVIVIFGITTIAMYTQFSFVRISYLEAPEIRGLIRVELYFYLFCSLNLILAVILFIRPKMAHVFYFTILLPYMLIYSSLVMNIDIRTRAIPNVYDKAGLFAKQYFETYPVKNVLVLSPYKSGLLRTIFHFDRTDIDYLSVGKTEYVILNKYIDQSELSDVEGVIVIGVENIQIDSKFEEIDMIDYSLFRLKMN